MEHEQPGVRYGGVPQSDDLYLSTLLIAPTSTSVRPGIYRPKVAIGDQEAFVLVAQPSAVAPERLGAKVGHLTFRELTKVNEAAGSGP